MTAALILASASPRRKRLIEQMGLQVDVRPVDIDETFGTLPPKEEAIRLSKEKIEAALVDLNGPQTSFHQTDDGGPWVLAADTIVAVDEEKLGKPEDAEQAREFLLLMQGRSHQVITGLSMFSNGRGITSEAAVTEVRFAALNEAEIEWYLSTGEWKGVAAGYRIQEKAARFIPSISGSYSNVMGLPIHAFYGMLSAHGYPLYEGTSA